jgi:hypothetical protein
LNFKWNILMYISIISLRLLEVPECVTAIHRCRLDPFQRFFLKLHTYKIFRSVVNKANLIRSCIQMFCSTSRRNSSILCPLKTSYEDGAGSFVCWLILHSWYTIPLALPTSSVVWSAYRQLLCLYIVLPEQFNVLAVK